MRVKDVDWETILRRLKSHPHEAAEKDKFGATALHHAIRKQQHQCDSNNANNIVPTEIFRLLIEEYPDSLDACDSITGCNALHIACSSRFSDEMKEIIMIILEKKSETVMQLCRDGRLALHRSKHVHLARRLVEIYPQGVSEEYIFIAYEEN